MWNIWEVTVQLWQYAGDLICGDTASCTTCNYCEQLLLCVKFFPWWWVSGFFPVITPCWQAVNFAVEPLDVLHIQKFFLCGLQCLLQKLFKLFITWCTACKVQPAFYFRLFLNFHLVRVFVFEDTLTWFRMGFLISISSQMLCNICWCVFVGTHRSCSFDLTSCHFFIHYYVIL